MDEQLIIEIWEIFKYHVPDKSRDGAAHQYVDFLISRDVDTDELEGILGYDPHLDNAIELILDEHDEDDYDEEYEDDYDEE